MVVHSATAETTTLATMTGAAWEDIRLLVPLTRPMIIKTSRVYALNDISTGEYITFIFFDGKRNPIVELRHLTGRKKNYFFEMDPSFLLAKLVKIQ